METALHFTATLDNDGTLPAWLTIDHDTGILSGTPANFSDVDTDGFNVKVTATDLNGNNSASLSASETFKVTVNNTTPVVLVNYPSVSGAESTTTAATSFVLTGDGLLEGAGNEPRGPPERGIEILEEYVAAGATDIVLDMSWQPDEVLAQLKTFSQLVMPHFS